MKRETIETIVADLRAGRVPELAVEDFPAFSEEATAGDAHIGPATLEAIAATLTEADIPTFERALRAMDEGDLAWLGFKVVYDGAAAQGNVDNEVTKKYGEQVPPTESCLCSSATMPRKLSPPASCRPAISSRRRTSPAALDAQRSVRRSHLGQRAFIREGARLAAWSVRCCRGGGAAGRPRGFHVVAVDYDPAFLNEERFPTAERIMLHGATSTSWLTCRGALRTMCAC